MPDNPNSIALRFPATPEQLAAIDTFQAAERLATREETLALLVEIALDTVAARGSRFWDWRIAKHDSALTTDEIYRSSNGDVWLLLRDAAAGRALVRHQPNAASGGQRSDMSVQDFLDVDGHGPEHAALRALLGDCGGQRRGGAARATEDAPRIDDRRAVDVDE